MTTLFMTGSGPRWGHCRCRRLTMGHGVFMHVVNGRQAWTLEYSSFPSLLTWIQRFFLQILSQLVFAMEILVIKKRSLRLPLMPPLLTLGAAKVCHSKISLGMRDHESPRDDNGSNKHDLPNWRPGVFFTSNQSTIHFAPSTLPWVRHRKWDIC